MKKLKKLYNKIRKRLNEISVLRYIKTNILFLSYAIINILFSWLLRIVTMGSLFNFKAILSDAAFVSLIGSFCYLTRPKNQIKVLFPITFVLMLICIINAVYYENYVSFASFSLLSTASFLGDMDGSIITGLIHFKDIILVLSPFLLLIVHIILKKRDYYSKVALIEKGKKRFVNTIILGGFLTLFTILMMSGADYSRLKKQWNREYLVERFGIYVYQLNDIIKSTESKFTSLFGYDNASKTVREFYENKDNIKTSNKYTNIFEGRNVIVIHAESIMTEDLSLSFNNSPLTPNLNKLASEGLYFSNYYPQVSVGTSSDTEFTFNTSLLPSSTGTVFVNYWDRTYEAMPKILSSKGYYTASFHANNASFWNRNVMHENLGYKKFYARDSFVTTEENTVGMGLSDYGFFDQSIDKIKKIKEKNKNYYLTFITLSNHTPWDDEDKYGDYTVDYKTGKLDANGNEIVYPYMEGSELGRYFKSVHYADGALGEFINKLDQNGLLDNTIIVIYGDHDAKISKGEYRRFYNYNLETGEVRTKDDSNYVEVDYYKYELNRKVPFIIWTKNSKGNKLLNKEIKTVMGMYDAMPTLANMLNFNYEYALGHDIFSNNDNIVVFPNSNWVTNDIYYNAQKDEAISLNNSKIDIDKVKKNKEYAETILDVSNSIIVYDLESGEKK